MTSALQAHPAQTSLRHRWFSVGRSRDPDGRSAGREAAAHALTAASPKLVIVFCWDGHDLPRLLEGVREVTGDTPLIGCSTAGEIATGGPGDRGVVVTVLGGDGFSVATGAARVDDGDVRAASQSAAECLDQVEDRGHSFLLLLSDGLTGDQEEVVRGAYQVSGAGIPLVGGCAGDGLMMSRTFLLHGDQALPHGVVAAAVSSDGPVGIGVHHGWRRVGAPVVVTASDGPTVQRLDDQPALDVYLSRLGAPPEAWEDPAAFTAYASTHPFGLRRRRGEEVRYVAGADFEQRSIECIAAVPQGGLAWFMEGDADSVLQASAAAGGEAVEALGGVEPLGLLAFDCIARRGVLGDDGIAEEVERIAALGAGAPLAGFYTYGEIARTRGVNGFHNQTLVVLALG